MLTLPSMIDRSVRLFGDRPAVVDPEGGYTWAEFGERTARAAGVLGSLGVKAGDRYAILCRNGYRNAEIMHAGYWMGAVPVPINTRLAPPEIAYILENAGCGLVAVEDAFADLMAEDALARWRANALLVGSSGAAPNWPRYDALLEAAAPAAMVDAAADADALLVYTGGTTGRPKGVRLSHRNIMVNALQIGCVVAARPEDIFLRVAPMFHSADLLANPYTLAGAAHVYMAKFSGAALLEAIQTHRVTASMLTPTMIIMALQEPDFDRYDLSSLRQVIYGSSPMAAEWIRKALDRFAGVEFIQAYGLTETAPLLTMLTMAEHRAAIETGAHERLKSVGRALAGVDLRILDDAGAEVPVGEVGEVAVRAPNVAAGYWQRPEETAEAFRDGWFHTGDVGRVDAQGRLYLLDRKKDLIITGGENVYSLEIEAVLYRHPMVSECAVVGVPDETYGEALLAAIVAAPGESPAAEDLIAHCRGKIGGYKIPRRYVFLDALPKSAMNKLLKNELRRRYGGGEAE